RAIDLLGPSGDRAGLAGLLGESGTVLSELGRHAEARDAHERARRLWEEVGSARGVAFSVGNLGIVAKSLGETAAAIRLSEEALRGFLDVDDAAEVGVALALLADTY